MAARSVIKRQTARLQQYSHIPSPISSPHLRTPSPTAPSRERPFHTVRPLASLRTPVRIQPKKPPLTSSRGPKSSEDTQTDFTQLDVLSRTQAPSTSVDVCTADGFVLDSGLRITDGDGVMLLGGEAFVWRPWMATAGGEPGSGIVTGNALRTLPGDDGTGGMFNRFGQWEVGEEAWGVLRAVWPKPGMTACRSKEHPNVQTADLLILGTGRSIRPLSPATREAIQALGMRVEVLDTRNAASQFNLLATERGVQEVAAALVPIGFGMK